MEAMPSGSSFARRRAWTNLSIKRSGRGPSHVCELSGINAGATARGGYFAPPHTSNLLASQIVHCHQRMQKGGPTPVGAARAYMSLPNVLTFMTWPLDRACTLGDIEGGHRCLTVEYLAHLFRRKSRGEARPFLSRDTVFTPFYQGARTSSFLSPSGLGSGRNVGGNMCHLEIGIVQGAQILCPLQSRSKPTTRHVGDVSIEKHHLSTRKTLLLS